MAKAIEETDSEAKQERITALYNEIDMQASYVRRAKTDLANAASSMSAYDIAKGKLGDYIDELRYQVKELEILEAKVEVLEGE